MTTSQTVEPPASRASAGTACWAADKDELFEMGFRRCGVGMSVEFTNDYGEPHRLVVYLPQWKWWLNQMPLRDVTREKIERLISALDSVTRGH